MEIALYEKSCIIPISNLLIMRAKREKPLEVECLKCGKTFLKKVSEIRNSPNHFCSRSCSTSYNNTVYAKRVVSGRCRECGASISAKYVYCQNCRSLRLFENRTVAEVVCLSNKASRYCRIREHARKLYQHITACEVCGYRKHVEICHIKPLSSYDVTALVSEVNNKDNIAVLCPNCHWELDNGLLNLLNRQCRS